ncbi:amino acid adenylation domain-containing protein [Cytophaga sp. FL35]|uniref:non-ribosomal peptide synthetase n=1 Tax=Cytophaga sp. FL35 TaxID=1904456 RepID=UPI00165341CF|nr:amino acid adenylation domain-containing protein [Cytophaga sp. FL35]MBC6998009.1 amino acid adenylation domain-containing protein [Cytophaga sp. FL35]
MEKKASNSSLLNRWKNRDKSKTSTQSTVPKAPEDAKIPLSSGQQRIWFLQQLYPENPFYNYSEALLFKGKLETQFLQQAFEQVCLNHEILRSYFPMENGSPVIKTSDLKPEIRQEDFSKHSSVESDRLLQALMREQSRTVFTLSSPLLLKASLVKLSEDSHVFFLTIHHIIVDEWSIGLLKNELATHYRALSSGADLLVSQPEIQYKDYAYWERNKEINPQALDYWKEKLSGEIPVLNLQTDFQRPAVPKFNGKQLTKSLSESFSKEVLNLATRQKTTPFNLLLAGFYVLLHKYTGQNDILVGTPVSNRNNKVLEDAFGFFVDTVVLRNSISENDSLASLIEKIKTNTLEAFSNKSIPFDVLVKELKVTRSLSVNPFFQVMFLYHPQEEVPVFGDEVQLSKEFEFDTEVAKFDLTLSISEKKGSLDLTFEYDTDLFQEVTIRRMLDHYEILLKQLVVSTAIQTSEIALLTEKEKAFFLERPARISSFLEYQGIHEVIGEVAKNNPDKKAVTLGDTSLSYQDLDSRAEEVAVHILNQRKGVSNGIIGLCVDRSMEMIIGLLGILKSGNAYLPIDPNYPMVRLHFILEDAQCSLLVSHSSLKDVFAGKDIQTLFIDELKPSRTKENITFPADNRNNLAYVIYTSGSSGKPKGVPITHDDILNSTAGRLDFYKESPKAFLLMSSISFDSSKAGIFWTLCTGGNLILTENRIEQDVQKVGELIEKNQVSHALMLPSLYALILGHVETKRLHTLNTVIVAGEACTPSLCQLHYKKLPSTKLYNEYGPTEATVWATAHEIIPAEMEKTVAIGRGVAGNKIYLLNKNLEMVPFGAVGEIYISGPSLAKGYLNRTELSSAVFLKNPFGHSGYEKMYKTGDLGRFRADGNLEFLGRADQQVKLRGYRIELEEVENAIKSLGTVTEVIAQVETLEIEKDSTFSDFDNADAFLGQLMATLEEEEIEQLLNEVEILGKTESFLSSRE